FSIILPYLIVDLKLCNRTHRLISYILTFIIAFIITLVYEQRRELKAEKNIRPVEDGTRTSGNG
ncbi:hypothetical protein, partial [Enterococcus faecium]|uniref:hypothetical protein n=1 Tax=Enterococcus faecium TaxID=1352 RepID=UPI001EDF3D92